MKEIKVNVAKSYTVPNDVTHLTITHEWGDVVVSHVAVSNTYTFTPDSIGVHKFTWQDGFTTVQTDFYSSYMPLITASEFLSENEDLEDFEDDFDKVERVIRHIIQNYTGQKFGPYVDKSMEVQGDGGDSLELPVRILALSSISNSFDDDITEMVHVAVGDGYFLQRASRFNGGLFYEAKRDIMWNSFELFDSRHVYMVSGDWGWEYVPLEVSEAAKLLMRDFLAGDDIQDMKQKGVFELQLGDFKLRLNADQWGTTGNAHADNLLSAHIGPGVFGAWMV